MTDTISIAKKEDKKKTSSLKKQPKTKNKKSVSEFFRQYIRVLKLARKPTKQEFWKISAITALGIAIVGILGFLIYLLFYYVLA